MGRKIAFGGIFTGLTIVLLYFAVIVPTGRLAAYVLCSLPVAFSIVTAGTTAGILVYAASAILAFFLIGDISGIIPYAAFFGHYGIFKYFIERNRSAVVELILKLMVFNASLAAAYLIYMKLLMAADIWTMGISGWWPAALLTAAQLIFLIYDYVFSRLINYFQLKINIFSHRSN